jgi:hypothetical protein
VLRDIPLPATELDVCRAVHAWASAYFGADLDESDDLPEEEASDDLLIMPTKEDRRILQYIDLSCIKASDLRQVRQCARFSSVICEPAHEVAASALCKCTATCLESSAVDKCLSCGGQGPEVTGCAVNKGCAEDKGRAAPVMRWTSACMASMCAACSGAVSAARPPTCGR